MVYFSLAALPLFGIGQWFIPASDTGGRRYVFMLMLVYVAAGLGLLLTTSFLGLRRYLRQRRIEMPTLMANLWLTTGVAIILVLLAAAAILPRPSAEYAIAELPFSLGSPERDASRVAPIKRDGTQDDEQGPAASRESSDGKATDEPPGGAGNQPEGEATGEGAGTASETESGQQAEGEGGKSSRGESEGGKSQQGEQPGSSGEKSADSNRSQQQQAQDQQSGKQQGDASETEQPGDDSSNSEPVDALRGLEQDRQGESGDASSEPSGEPPGGEPTSPPSPPELPSLDVAVSPLLMIFKWIIYALLALAVIFALLRYREEVMGAIRSFLAELAAWWNGLWGGKRDYGLAEDDALDIRVPPPPFASFADPFASGTAGSYSVAELVRYSFEAFEAWAREHGCEREPEQTPHELARRGAAQRIYRCRCPQSGGTLRPGSLWQGQVARQCRRATEPTLGPNATADRRGTLGRASRDGAAVERHRALRV